MRFLQKEKQKRNSVIHLPKPSQMIKPEITNYCAFCGDKFSTSKPNAIFCCNSCRTKAYVKRKQDEQIQAEKEAQQQLERELKEQQANARRIRREQRAEARRQEMEKQAELDRLAKETQSLKEEQIAAELAEQRRKENEIRQQNKEKEEAERKQLLADKKRFINLKRKIEDQKKQNAKNLFIGKSLLLCGIGALVYYYLTEPEKKLSLTSYPQKSGRPQWKEPNKISESDNTRSENDKELPITGDENSK